MTEPLFFATAAEFRDWLSFQYESSHEQWIGFYRKATGIPSMSYDEAVDQAICFGWIDGLRKRIDKSSYMIRFTPRKAGSTWSKKNVARIEALMELGMVSEYGVSIYEQRKPVGPDELTYDHRKQAVLTTEFLERFQADERAWERFQQMPPSYRNMAIWWVMRAKRPDTRERRMNTLISCSAEGEKIPPLRR